MGKFLKLPESCQSHRSMIFFISFLFFKQLVAVLFLKQSVSLFSFFDTILQYDATLFTISKESKQRFREKEKWGSVHVSWKTQMWFNEPDFIAVDSVMNIMIANRLKRRKKCRNYVFHIFSSIVCWKRIITRTEWEILQFG